MLNELTTRARPPEHAGMRMGAALVLVLVACGGQQPPQDEGRERAFAEGEARTRADIARGYGHTTVTDTAKQDPPPAPPPSDAGPATNPWPEGEPAEPQGGWWCTAISTTLGDAGMCDRDHERCDEMGDDVGAPPCAWQLKAVCFAFTVRLYGTRQQACMPSFGACEVQRKVVRKQRKDDIRAVGACKGTD